MPKASEPSSSDRGITEIAAQCVMCGLCLPHCPSYRITQNEAESPRGRLALMARIAANEIAAGPQQTLDSCLSCGNCERVCPAKVSFLQAITLTRAGHAPAVESFRGRAARQLSRHPAVLGHFARSAATLRSLLPKSLRRNVNLDGVADQMNIAARRAKSARGLPTATTVVLASCAATTLERRAITALQCIAEKLVIPLRIEQEICCGALDHHLGHQSPKAPAIDDEITDIVAINSGCTSRWREQLAPSRVTSITTWLERIIDRNGARFTHKPLRVALHLPCTQQRLEGEIAATRRLIDRLPGTKRIELPASQCCGAAGTFFLNHPQIAQPLGAEMAELIAAADVDVVVSANGGCRAQMAQALFDRSTACRVVHPAELVAEYLTDSDE